MADANAPHVELNTGDYPDLDPSKYISRNESFGMSKRLNGTGELKASVKTDRPKLHLLTGKTDSQAGIDGPTSRKADEGVSTAISQGPVAQSVKEQTSKASSEFKDLANSRTTPDKQAATGQPLTQYHSFFYRLLSWKNPRATGITFATVIVLIFAMRYLDFLRYVLKALYMVLGLSASIEFAGKAMFGNGLASQFRPKRYFTIPRESLERFLDDVEQLINFFVIETQRIVFAENIYATSAAFASTFISYWLIRILPIWGLSLIGTCIAFIAPLVYAQNKELIDANLKNAGDVLNKQAAQVKELAAQKTGKASETVKTYAGEYGHKAQEAIGAAKSKATAKSRSASAGYNSNDFPAAPKGEPLQASADGNKEAIAT